MKARIEDDASELRVRCNEVLCPKTGHPVRVHRKASWAAGLFSGLGLFSLVWFLVRVVPKPSRAAYPCQRVAFPMASGFVVWVVALLGTAFAWRKLHLRNTRTWRTFMWGAAALAGCAVLVASVPTARSLAGGTPNAPVGVAKGICPGRVAWVYAPQATSWAGYTSSEHWYESNHTDQAAVEVMVSKAIQSVGATNSDTAAWNQIFTYFNTNHGKTAVGYRAGEKIAIKINLVTCSARFGSATVDIYGTYEKQNSYDGYWLNSIDPSPQVLLSLLRQLVYTVGVDPTNICLGDPTANFPKYLWDRLHPEFPGVNYFDNLGGAGRMRVELSSVPFYWSSTNPTVQDYIPVPFAQADYLINLAGMKSHDGAGITACAKNFFGALLRCPDGYFRDAGGKDVGGTLGGYSDMHYGLPNSSSTYNGVSGLGHYRPQVDLLGHPSLGGKVVLYLVDALYCGQNWNAHPYPWNMAPFNGNWPSSLFASQDPVAIDSVCYDFLVTEWPTLINGSDLGGGAEDYLHEAAQANNPPSGIFYDPSKSGTRLASLGVHEHWNDSVNKQYSRNLDPVNGQGIELVQLTASRPMPKVAITQAGSDALISWPSSLNTFNYSVALQSTTNLAIPNSWSNVSDTPGFYQGNSVITNPAQGVRFYRLLEHSP